MNEDLPSINDFIEDRSKLPSLNESVKSDLPSYKDFMEERVEEVVADIDDQYSHHFQQSQPAQPVVQTDLSSVITLIEGVRNSIPEVKSYDKELYELMYKIEELRREIPEIPDIPDVKYYDKEIQELKESIPTIPEVKYYDEEIKELKESISEVKDRYIPDFRWIYKSFSQLDEGQETITGTLETLKMNLEIQIKDLIESVEVTKFESGVDNKSVNERVDSTEESIVESKRELIEVIEESKKKIYKEMRDSSLRIWELNKQYKSDSKKLKEETLSEYKELKENLEASQASLQTSLQGITHKTNNDFIQLNEFFESLKKQVGNLPKVKYYDEDINRVEKSVRNVRNLVEVLENKLNKKIEGLKESILVVPPTENNPDPLTPLDQNFATLDDLSNHYRLFLNRIQQQLSTLGGGGETRLEFLDDVDRDSVKVDGKFLKYEVSSGKWVGADGGGGSQNLDETLGFGNTSSLGMSVGLTTVSELHVGIDTGFFGEDLVVNGDARITGILTVGRSSIILNGYDDTIRGAIYYGDGSHLIGIVTDVSSLEVSIAANTAGIATNTAGIATNTANIAINAAGIATNTAGISSINSSLGTVEARVDALELVTTPTLIYDCENITGAAVTVSGDFAVNNTDASLVTQIRIASLDKNNNPPSSPVDGDTLLFVDSAGTGIEHRYTIVDASLGLSNLSVASVLTSGDAWAAGVEYETFLFPTNDKAVVVDSTAPSSPDIGAIWIDSATLIWYAWTGTAWVPAHLPPSMETRISDIETQQTQNTTNIANNTSVITSNTADISTNTANIATNTAGIATNTTNIATNTTKILTNEVNIASNLAGIGTNAAGIATNTTNIATNTANIAINAAGISTNTTGISSINSALGTLDARVDALELVTGTTLLYDCANTTGAVASSGDFSVNNTNASLVTQIRMGAVDKDNNLPSTPVDGDTLLFIDSAGTGKEHRYTITDASGGLSNLVVTNVLTSGDAWATGVEYETFLFPTNKSAVTVDLNAPVSPDIGTIWINSSTLIWYAWTGTAWVPAHLPPSMETRISDIETQQTQNTSDIATKISESDGDARYLQLSGGTLTGNVTSQKKIIVDAPRVLGTPTNSFIIRGRLGGVDSQSLLYDYKPAAENSLDSRVYYKGSITEDDEITTKKYVDDEIADISAGNPNATFNITSTGNTWYKLIDLRSNNTYEVLVEVENGADTGSVSLTAGIDGFPTRNSFIKVNQVVGTGNYQFRIGSTNDLEVKPLDSGTVILKVVITGDSHNTGANDIITTMTTSSAPSSYVETANVFTAKGGGTYGTSGTVDIVDYSNKIQLANVADPTDGTMVGDRDYNDARYEPLRSGTGNTWGSSYNPITLTNAVDGVDNYRKIVALQVYAGSHTDTPGWSATYGSSRTKVNFSTGFQEMSIQWPEGSNQTRTVFSINKSQITSSGNYLRDSNQFILVSNSAQASNKVKAGMGIVWAFEFFRGSSCGLGCGWTAHVTAEYISVDGRTIPSTGMFNCNTINLSNMKDLVLWGQSGYASWGRWNIVADY